MLRLGVIGLLIAGLLVVLIGQLSPPAPAVAAADGDRRTSSDDESPEAVRERLERMSAEEREALRRRSDRFYDFSPEKQQRLRNLHRQLTAQPDEQRLRDVLDRYTQWLRNLSSNERSQLLSLPADERISRIKELKQEQETRRFRGFVNLNLAREDFGEIYDWLDGIIARNEQQLLERLSPERREFFTSEEDDARRRRRLMFAVWSFRGPPEFRDMPALIAPADIDQLISGLSPVAKTEMEKADTPEKRLELVQRWGRATLFARFRPEIKPADLEAFFETLSTEEQQRLEQMPSDTMRRELERLYLASQVRGDSGGFRGFGGRDGGRFPSRGRGGFGGPDGQGGGRGGPDGPGGRRGPGGQRGGGNRPSPGFSDEGGRRGPPPGDRPSSDNDSAEPQPR